MEMSCIFTLKPDTRTISGSSNASAKDITVAIQEVSEERGEGVKETTEVPITTQARASNCVIKFYSFK